MDRAVEAGDDEFDIGAVLWRGGSASAVAGGRGVACDDDDIRSERDAGVHAELPGDQLQSAAERGVRPGSAAGHRYKYASVDRCDYGFRGQCGGDDSGARQRILCGRRWLRRVDDADVHVPRDLHGTDDDRGGGQRDVRHVRGRWLHSVVWQWSADGGWGSDVI